MGFCVPRGKMDPFSSFVSLLSLYPKVPKTLRSKPVGRGRGAGWKGSHQRPTREWVFGVPFTWNRAPGGDIKCFIEKTIDREEIAAKNVSNRTY